MQQSQVLETLHFTVDTGKSYTVGYPLKVDLIGAHPRGTEEPRYNEVLGTMKITLL